MAADTLVTAAIRTDLVRKLELYVLARRREEGPGTRLSRSAIVREIVEPAIERMVLPPDLACQARCPAGPGPDPQAPQ